MQKYDGAMVRLEVAEWYDDPEFQAWFNKNLGRGLSTWRHANDPLTVPMFTADQCKNLHDRLRQDVLEADVLVDGDEEGVVKARETLDHFDVLLTHSAKADGMTLHMAKKMAKCLDEDVLFADVLFDVYPAMATAEQSESEQCRRDTAEETLHNLVATLSDENSFGIDRYAYSDCFVGVEPASAEGTDSDMPERFWEVIVNAAHQHRLAHVTNHHVIVWLAPA